MTEATTLALVAILGTVITALFKLLDNNTKALKSLAETNDKMAAESKQRNGHLGEMILQQGEQVKSIADQAVAQIVDKVQHVQKQEVEHQHIKSQE